MRAALCADAETARRARRWNDANVLSLSLRTTTEALSTEMLDVWFATTESDSTEAGKIQKGRELDERPKSSKATG